MRAPAFYDGRMPKKKITNKAEKSPRALQCSRFIQNKNHWKIFQVVGAEMILKRYPGLFNIFADSNQRVVEHLTPAQAV